MTSRSKAPVRILLEDMLTHAKQAAHALGGHTASDLANDVNLVSLVLWPLTILGEAASQLPNDYIAKHPEVEFKLAILNRNRLVHGYRTVDFRVVQHTVNQSLPPLIADLERLLQEEPPLP